MGKKYLITGHKGFIGRNLIQFMDDMRISYTFSDWSNTDCIIHLSALTNVRKSILNPRECFVKNIEGTFNVLMNAKKFDISDVIFTSSMGVSDPKSPYLSSKLAGEALCTSFRESYNINTHIVRLSNVYGPCSEFKDSVIPSFIKSVIENKTFYINGNGSQTRDFIYVGDIVRLITKQTGPKSHLSSGTTTTISNLVSIMLDISKNTLGKIPKIKHKPQSKGEINRVRDASGIHNPTNLYKGLKETFEWFSELQ